MCKRLFVLVPRWSLLPLLLLIAVSGAYGHHSRAGIDLQKTVSVTGTVQKFFWASPHIYVRIDVANDEGGSDLWQLEGQSPAVLRALDWSKESLESGMTITATGNPTIDPDKHVMMFHTIEVAGTGATLYANERLYNSANAGNLAEVTPSTDFQGIWERKLTIDPTAAGVFDPPKGWPLTQAAEALLANFDLDENPALSCEPLGVPRGINYAYGLQIRREGDLLIFDKELRPDNRVVHLGQTDFPDDIEPSLLGYAIGNIEDDLLRVRSKGFAPEKWGLGVGIDSSAEKEVIEQWKLVDGGLGMEVRFTLIDPVYLSEPVTIDLYMEKVADREMAEDLCDPEQAKLYRAEEF